MHPVLCFYILFIVIVFLSRKTNQVSVTLSLWDTEVSEYILLKIFEIYKEQMFVYDAWQWEAQASIKKYMAI